MGNIIDYLRWRGDITFVHSPFCEVDALIITYLAYVDLDGIVPGAGLGFITVEDAARIFEEKYSPEQLKEDRSFVRMAYQVLKAMAVTDRYRNGRLRNYVNQIDEEQELQFAALELLLDDGTSFIAFRGTDDTIVGWKEDFNLSRGKVPSEGLAVTYLNQTGAACQGEIRVGGHSKGGHLAVYGAAACDEAIQKNIIKVYDNDGPGFAADFFNTSGFQRIRPLIQRTIPESSVIGMLLKHVVEPVIIQSSQKGVMQHDGMSWQVLGSSFVYKEGLDKKTQAFNVILGEWLDGLDNDRRDGIVDDLFQVLEATGAHTLTQIQEGGIKNAAVILKQIEGMNPQTRESIDMLIRSFVAHWDKLLK